VIRLGSHDEAIEILSEPQTVARLGMIPETMKTQPWIAYNETDKLLFVFWEVDDAVYEMHIASPKSSIRSCRKLAYEAMNWIFDHGAEKIITNCIAGKIANMAEKLGMRLKSEIDGKKYYEASQWELKQQS